MAKQLALVLVLVGLLSGCQFLDNLRAKILKQTSDTASGITKTVENVNSQIKKTKDSVEKKVNDVRNAVKEVGEAVDAVKKVTGEDGAQAPNRASGEEKDEQVANTGTSTSKK
ncbi:MAG: hypothetical protein AAB588_05370 [Patescibacteria group bacterium]